MQSPCLRTRPCATLFAQAGVELLEQLFSNFARSIDETIFNWCSRGRSGFRARRTRRRNGAIPPQLLVKLRPGYLGVGQLVEDSYGVYDSDFNWQTDDEWFARESEQAHYGLFGYDDAGDAGWFDL
jgi:hypothetical protein